jgi:hypothetical protein
MSASMVIAVIILFVAAFGVYTLYTGDLFEFLPPSVEQFTELGDIIEEAEPEIASSSVSLEVNNTQVDYPTLVPNPRWNHMPIKVYLDTSTGEGLANFGEDDIDFVRQSLKTWEEKTEGIISFEEVGSLDEGEVIISWFPSLTEITGGRVVGEGGPTRAIETGGAYTLIEGGEIFLIPTDNKCVGVNRPVHEMGHVLGLGHAPPGHGDIMFSREISCQQNITDLTVNAIKELYRVPANPDLAIVNVTAIKKGGELDINLTIRNVGLKDSVQTSLSFVGDGKKIDSLSVPKFSVVPRIEPGSGVSLIISKVRVPSSLTQLVVKIDSNDEIVEMSEKNNDAIVNFRPV